MAGKLAWARERLTFANVVAITALFVALGGSAWALATNSVRSKHIANGQVKRADIARNAVNAGHIKNGQVKRADIAANAIDADKLAGDAWHEIGTAGEPSFTNNGFCRWENVGADQQSGAFFRDVEGIVRLKGMVRAVGTVVCDFGEPTREDHRIFTLPPGYRPQARAHFATVTNGTLGRVVVYPDGRVFAGAPTTVGNAIEYLSLEGLSFPAAAVE